MMLAASYSDTVTGITSCREPSATQRYAAARSRIEDSAHEAFVRYGYAATTIESIAALAGVSARTVYRHFGSKAALVVRPMQEWMQAYVDAVRERAHPDGMPVALVSAVGSLDLDHLPRRFFRELTADRDARGAWLTALAAQQDALAQVLREAPAPSVAGVLRSRLCAALVLSAIDTGFRAWLNDDAMSTARPALEQALREAAAVIEPITTL